MEQKILLILLSISLILFLSALGSALSFDSGTILNTSVSNSSITFSIPVTADTLTIEPNYIYLTNVQYLSGGYNYQCSTLNHSIQNSVLDSANFSCICINCGGTSSGGGSGSDAGGSPIYQNPNYTAPQGDSEILGKLKIDTGFLWKVGEVNKVSVQALNINGKIVDIQTLEFKSDNLNAQGSINHISKGKYEISVMLPEFDSSNRKIDYGNSVSFNITATQGSVRITETEIATLNILPVEEKLLFLIGGIVVFILIMAIIFRPK